MSKKIQPCGTLIIVNPNNDDNIEQIEGGLFNVSLKTSTGIVIESSTDVEGLPKIGETVLYSSGTGDALRYQGKNMLYIDGRGRGIGGGDIWAIIKEEK